MDSAIKHWGAFRRQFPSRFRVTNLALIPAKQEWMRTAFDTCNFGLILSGRGIYRRDGVEWAVEAPAVITQLSDRYQEYGPLPGETWEELYIVYDRSLEAEWKATGILDENVPVWSIADRVAVDAQLLELSTLVRMSHPEEVADRLDRVCERLIFETRKHPGSVSEGAPTVVRMAAEMRREFHTLVDFDRLAARHGMSPSTFRRRWQQVMGMPPARYVQELRIQAACRQLVESNRPVREIAEQVGFEDGLYFSRRFRLETGVSPREYRRRYRIGQR